MLQGQDKVVIVMGSRRDDEFTQPIRSTLEQLGVPFELRIASAHKTPYRVLEMLRECEGSRDRLVYITVAGRSNALSGLVDANTRYPVIACPPLSGTFGAVDVYSSLRMPSGVAPLVVLEPENAALAAAKILALTNEALRESVRDYQQRVKGKLVSDDESVRITE